MAGGAKPVRRVPRLVHCIYLDAGMLIASRYD